MDNTHVGPFHVIRKVGAHRRHNVYLARQTEQDREVALKFIKLPPHVEKEAAYAKINREVQVLKQLDHPNLVQLYGAGVHGDQVFFAHELIDGEALSALLGRRSRLAVDQVIEYGAQLASVLEYLHSNEIMHAKLTTDKVLIDAEGKVKLSDLRLNRSRKRRWDAAKRASLEIAAYMAPEQLLGEGATIKTDIYSMGVILYEMLTGQLPFEPQTMAQLARDKQSGNSKRVADSLLSCPSWLDKLINSMIAADPKARPHTMKAVLLTLERIRKVDQSKKAVVEEMTGGFSALTAGKDRTEARRLMGHKPVKEKKSGPLLQSLPFLLSGVALLVFVSLLIAFWPFSMEREDIMTRADNLLASTQYEDWRAARKLYEKMMDSSDPEIAEQANEKYKLARRKSMLHRLDNAIASGLEKREIKEFKRGYMLEKDNRLDQAVAMYREFISSFDLESPRLYVRDEAEERLNRLVEAKKSASAAEEEIREQLTQAKKLAKSEETVNEARDIWMKVADTYIDNPYLKQFVATADAGLLAHPQVGEKEPDEGQEAGAEEGMDPETVASGDTTSESETGETSSQDQDESGDGN